jgi:TolB-like protein
MTLIIKRGQRITVITVQFFYFSVNFKGAAMEKLTNILCDLAEFKILLQFHARKTPLVVYFDTPSRRFYFSIIALIITEMKKQDRPGFIHIHRHQKILTILDKSLSGKNASKHVNSMWAKIKMAWCHRLPDLEAAVLFKVLDRDLVAPYEKGGKYRYKCSESECDVWAGLFGYDENNKWRYKFECDAAGAGLDDISIKLGDLWDNSAWEEFVNRLRIEAGSDQTPKKPVDITAIQPSSKDETRRTWSRKSLWGWAAIVATVTIAVVAWRLTLHKTQVPAESVDQNNAVFPLTNKPSLAVLPFENMTGDPQQEYFSDGISDQLITSLSKGPYLYVTARTSSFAFKGKPMQAQEIAEKLGVQYLIEGSVQRDNNRVRINIQLIDGSSGNHIWTEQYDRKYEDLFALQDEVTMGIMAFLNVKITGSTTGSLEYSRPNNLQAYEYYLKGVYYHLGRKKEDINLAHQMFEEAINRDPAFGSAYRFLGFVYCDEFIFRTTKTPEESLEKAEKAAQKALKVDPNYPPYTLWSQISRLKKDYEDAIVNARKGVEQEPNEPYRYFFLSLALFNANLFEEAISAMETALQLTRLPPVNLLSQLAWCFFGNKQFQEANKIFNEILDRDENSFYGYLAYIGLTASCELIGNHERATWAAENVMRRNPKFSLDYMYKNSFLKNGPFKETVYDAYRKAGLK